VQQRIHWVTVSEKYRWHWLIHRPYLESMVDHALSINNNSDNHSSIEQDPADTLTNLLFELITIATNAFGGFFKCFVPAARSAGLTVSRL